MEGLVQQLAENGLIEEDDGPWGALIVLATKAQHREHVPWHEYDWRLCVSYRALNRVTRPFKFPIPRCDDAVSDLPPDARVKILTDMASGYWQVTVEEASRGRLAFFAPNGKWRWVVMPMGALNSHAIFVCMMTVIQAEWNVLARQRNIFCCGSATIVDDICLWAVNVATMLLYFPVCLEVLKHYRATLKLKKTQFLPQSPEFVGITLGSDGNSPTLSKYEAFRKIPRPETWSDLSMLIGMFGFYKKWLPLYEVHIQPW